jgi:hypothetical protein
MRPTLATVVCVWHPDTNELLFEGFSTVVGVDQIRDVVGEAFPANTGAMMAHPVSVEVGRELLALMGLPFGGEGEFEVSREYVRRPGVEARALFSA